MSADDEWIFVGVVPNHSGMQREIRSLLAERGLERPNEQDIRIDTICTREPDAKSEVRVMVRRSPTPLPPRKKPRALP
jgi:hypothetical protein